MHPMRRRLGRLLEESFEDGSGQLVRKYAHQVGSAARRHCARDVPELLERQETRNGDLLVIRKALEDERPVARGNEREDLCHLFRRQIRQRVGHVLRVKVLQERPELVRGLRDELLLLRPEQCREAHVASLPYQRHPPRRIPRE